MGDRMIERLTIEGQCYAEQADSSAAEQPRLSLAWYLDPITGKPAARWVLKEQEVLPAQELATAA